MFKRKQDVDKHVTSILSRKRDEKERQAQGFQIARLYYEIKEYVIAKRYLSGFLQVRENVPSAHQLMGEINEALGEKEEAIENFKRALNLGSYGSSNKQLVLKICELYCELGTDIERMKYWCDQCEKFYPKSDVVFRLKTMIAEATNGQTPENSKEIENLVVSELVNHPTDLKLRLKLLDVYMDSERYEEAYDTAISTDLTTAFVDRLNWFEYLLTVFQVYGDKFPDSKTDLIYNEHFLHVLRNITYLSLRSKDVDESVQNLQRFDKQLKRAASLTCKEEEWLAMLQEMKGQLFFLAGLVLLKRAQTGTVGWQEVCQLSGACFLASHSLDPIDPQSPWFVRSPQGRAKFNNWWYLQSYDRLSQVGHMIQQLSHNDIVDWSKVIRRSVMTTEGHKRVLTVLYSPQDMKVLGETSYLYQAKEMVDISDSKEPITESLLIDIDRVAYQVHMSNLPHLVWLCLQRYSYDMQVQPNYHFNLFENIQFSTKNLETGAAESLCQLDILVFLLAAVQCAASTVAEKSTGYEEKAGRPSLLPVSLSRPLCTHDQEEWWTAAYKFCTNSVKDDFSRLRRTLIRGIETVRLIGPHGVSVSLIVHIARSLDAKVKSLRQAEHGARCPANELMALESRAVFYWEKAKQALLKLQRNHQMAIPKNRLFKEAADTDVPPRLVDKYWAETTFALSLAAMRDGQLETALEGFEGHRNIWAKFYCAQIYKNLAERESDGDSQADADKRQALIFKARDYLFDVMDMLDGDKAHELNLLVSEELDDLETKIHDLEISNARGSTFYTPIKSPAPQKSSSNFNGVGYSTPQNPLYTSQSHSTHEFRGEEESPVEAKPGTRDHSLLDSGPNRPRPSPERLDLQIKSLSYSQASLFKMVMDRNEELIMINGKMMEELRDNNNQLKSVLSENKVLMEELKTFLGDNRDIMKQIKSELSSLKPAIIPAPQAQVSPATPLFVPHMPTPPAPRGPFPTFPAQPPVVPMAYGNYALNSTIPAQPPVATPQQCPSGLPGMRASNVGKYRPQSEEEDEDEEDLSNIDDASAMYRDYIDAEQSYTQFYTPESQMLDFSHSARTALETQPPLSMPPFPPRMSIPAGYFASALRGQTLQYAATSQTAGQVKAATPGPGFFSTPPAPTTGPAGGVLPVGLRMPSALPTTTPVLAGATPPVSVDSSQSPALMAALTGQQRSITTGAAKPDVTPTTSTPAVGPVAASGIHSLFQAKAVLEPKKTKGDVTILVDNNINRATILMMGETRDILFHHDIGGLKLEPSFQPTVVSWTGIKIGSVEQEKIVLSFESPAQATQLKEAIFKAGAIIQPKTSAQQTPKIFGTVSATSTPVTTSSAKTALFGGLPASKDAPKFLFGGLTFSSAPTIETAADKERAKVEPHKQQPAATAPSKGEVPKPFAGFSLTTANSTTPKLEVQFSPQSSLDAGKSITGADKTASPLTSQKSQGALQKSPGFLAKSPAAGEDEHVEEYEPNVDFKPVIALPELVEKKTGEENETEIFVERCRLFRFDPDAKQWKERGTGEMKILQSKDQVKFRIVMRRDQILKLCANHFLTAEMKLTPMASSDRAWCYFAMDFSEEEIKHEQLAVKFKTAEKAKAFQEKFNDCCRQLKEAGGDSATASEEGVKIDSTGGKAAADSAKGGSSSTNSQSLSSLFKPKAGSWECDGCLIRNNEDVIKCVACNTPKPGSKPATAAAASTSAPSLSEMFKPKTGSWECDGCLVRNNEDVVKCVACGTLKPGHKADITVKDKPGTGFLFGNMASSGSAESGFKFGASTSTSAVPSTGGFVFKAPAVTTASGTAFKFGSGASSVSSSTNPPATGFVFNAPGASATNTTSAVLSTTTNPATSGFFFKPTTVAVPSTTAPVNPTLAPTTAAPTAAPDTGSIFKTGIQSTKPGFTVGVSTATTTTSATFATSTPVTTSAAFNFGGGFKFSGAGKAGSSTPATTQTSSGLLAKLLTSDDSATEEILASKSKSAAGFNFTMSPKPTTAFGGADTSATASSSKGFQFSFTKTPPKSQAAAVVPGSPEVDEHGMYVTKEDDDSHIHFEPVVKLPDKIEVKTGEEDEDILFESRGKMYRFISGEWKEKGVGVVKILKHKVTKKTRVLMRRDQVLKICCNHMIEAALNLQPMARGEGKAWVWYALDFTEDEGKMEQLAVRFRTAEVAAEFKKVFDECRDGASPQKLESGSIPELSDTSAAKKELFRGAQDAASQVSDGDVIFVGEDEPTEEQKMLARKYLLPDTFYLYESKPPCPGCIGCWDGEPPTHVTPASTSTGRDTEDKKAAKDTSKDFVKDTSKEASKDRNQESQRTKETTVQDTPLFGGAAKLPDFASLTSETTADKAGGGFLFGSGASIDFSSLAASGKTSDFSWNKASSSSTPFKFAGAGQKLFGSTNAANTSGDGCEGEGDDSGVVPSEDIHFEPVIPLPELVKVKTGEEDWTSLFCQRAKLYKFDKQASQWKERGIGDIKIMSHNTSTMFRVLQRREQVLKVSCNHLITADMELKPMATSETSWCWIANDLTESEPSVEQFAVKFKTKEIAEEFKTVFESCQEKLKISGQQKDKPQELQPQDTPVQQQQQSEATDKDEEDDGEDEDYEEEEEEEDDETEDILFEKRVTLNVFEDGKWKKLGMGSLQVIHNEDLNGNGIRIIDDDGATMCSHVVCRENTIVQNQKNCEWQPIDYTTDEPLRRHFMASFSSNAAAEEFASIFKKSQRLAVDSEISETLPNEMDHPVIFSSGESGHKG